MTVIRRL